MTTAPPNSSNAPNEQPSCTLTEDPVDVFTIYEQGNSNVLTISEHIEPGFEPQSCLKISRGVCDGETWYLKAAPVQPCVDGDCAPPGDTHQYAAVHAGVTEELVTFNKAFEQGCSTVFAVPPTFPNETYGARKKVLVQCGHCNGQPVYLRAVPLAQAM